MNAMTFEQTALPAARLLKAMANEHRLMILCQLGRGEKTVGELAALVDLSQPALSQHLARLRAARLVSTRRVSQTIHYALSSPEATQVIETLAHLYCPDIPSPTPPPTSDGEKS